MGYGFSSTKRVTAVAEIETTIGSDELGTIELRFTDPIILDDKNGTYRLYNCSSGDLQVTFLPIDSYE